MSLGICSWEWRQRKHPVLLAWQGATSHSLQDPLVCPQLELVSAESRASCRHPSRLNQGLEAADSRLPGRLSGLLTPNEDF